MIDQGYKQHLIDKIEEIGRRAQQEAQPYIDRLIKFEQMSPPKWPFLEDPEARDD